MDKITFKIIISVFGALGLTGLLYALFKYIVVKFFENILNTQLELITEKNNHAIKLTKHCKDIDNIKDDIIEIKSECKVHKEWKNDTNKK